MTSFFIISVLIVATLVGFGAHVLIKKMIDPRKNGGTLLLYFLLHFAVIFAICFLINYCIIYISGME